MAALATAIAATLNQLRYPIRYPRGKRFGGIPFFSSSLDVHALIHDLTHALTIDGAVSLPLLSRSATEALRQEAERLPYEPEIKTVGTGDRIVQTEYSACNQFPETGLFSEFQQAFQILIAQACDRLHAYPFSTPLQFTEMVVQRYEPGQLGITPHRDSLRAVNLIALINLSGQAEFYRCSDRQGNHAVRLDTSPGRVIFLRAPGFLNLDFRDPDSHSSDSHSSDSHSSDSRNPDSRNPDSRDTDIRPFHFVTHIRSTRYSLGLRQRIEFK